MKDYLMRRTGELIRQARGDVATLMGLGINEVYLRIPNRLL